MTRAPRIAISLGDPGGIGPEITVRALAAETGFTPVVYGARAVWERACRVAGVELRLQTIAHAGEAVGPSLVEADAGTTAEFPYGAGDRRSGEAQFECLRRAVDDVLAGHADGLCTAPVNKAAIDLVRPGFHGHTEYLQERFGVPRVVMLMAGEKLRVALATTHVAIADVPRRLTVEGLVEVSALVAKELRERFGVADPRLAFCGLNPHAGEQGRFGDEESRLIAPAMETLRRQGIRVEGPFPADGLFPRIERAGFDAVVAMFHDQGLIPFKMLAFHDGVNVTLGLPRPRTSPDHGVAYDIAGEGVADPRSMRSALRLCVRLAGRA